MDKLKCVDWDARFCPYDCKKENRVVNDNNLQNGTNETIVSWESIWKFLELSNTHIHI